MQVLGGSGRRASRTAGWPLCRHIRRCGALAAGVFVRHPHPRRESLDLRTSNVLRQGNARIAMRYDCFPVSIWDARADDDVSIRWARDVWSAVRPFSAGGVHANNLGDEGEDRVRAAYGANHARLAALKAKYDPSNVFRLNQNVRPSSSPT
ncbi:MAG: BBE domain-containing protein [Ramlibacter sp.]